MNSELLYVDTVGYSHASGQFFRNKKARTQLTKVPLRDAANLYQLGTCFYCGQDMSVGPDGELGCLDYFFPLKLEKILKVNLDLNGIWNQVLACECCHHGPQGKHNSVPELKYLELLHERNEFLIPELKTPRRLLTTGETELARRTYLEGMHDLARHYLHSEWQHSV